MAWYHNGWRYSQGPLVEENDVKTTYYSESVLSTMPSQKTSRVIRKWILQVDSVQNTFAVVRCFITIFFD